MRSCKHENQAAIIGIPEASLQVLDLSLLCFTCPPQVRHLNIRSRARQATRETLCGLVLELLLFLAHFALEPLQEIGLAAHKDCSASRPSAVHLDARWHKPRETLAQPMHVILRASGHVLHDCVCFSAVALVVVASTCTS